MDALSFTSPLLLIGLLALPAIWFLLRATPPAPQRVKFPAFDLLRRLSKPKETPDRTPWWILVLRLLIAGLVILGLAGPILNAPPPPSRAGPLVLVVDNSWAAAPGWRLRREAIAAAAEQAARAQRETYLIATAGALEEAPRPMTGEELRDEGGELDPEPLLPDYAAATDRIAALPANVRDADILFLSDGLDHPGAKELMSALRSRGAVVMHVDNETPGLALYPPRRSATQLAYRVDRFGEAPFRGDIVAEARDGRELARASVVVAATEWRAEATIDLPLALQNDMAMTRLDGVASAGAVQLVDARERRALIGFVATGEADADPLLSGAHYVRQALDPYAMFVTDGLEDLIASDASVIVLDDVGVLRPSDAEALTAWIEKGGVLIRFAGPTLAEAAGERPPALLPVELRGGGRAFGGALTWETPQLLGSVSPDGPFAGLLPPKDVYVRRQVLAEPGGETSLKTWASLSDGTPLVTGASMGAGALALFHVTATPDWSDLPLSAAFIEMLRKLVFLSTLGPERAGDETLQKAAPFRVLDGFGALKQPARDLAASSIAEIDGGAAPGRPPGLYGAPEAPIALNAVREGDVLAPVSAPGADIRPYRAESPLRLAPPLFLAAILLLIADALVALRLAGALRLAAIAVLIAVSPQLPARAAPLDPPIDAKAEAGALAMRLAFVRTGDPATDRVSEAGLSGLSRELTRRTSAEPAEPAGVDPETDDLSVYPFLYWPITAGAAAPSEAALANIESFMRFGGLIVFDTRDDERAIDGVDTPESLALKSILGGLDLPPLAPVSEEHVLHRSFYLLADLPGRTSSRAVWAQAGGGPNDSVTPLIIGGRDWASAWASDGLGRPLFPMTAGGERAREISVRAGINMVMVALTGNYKSDQVHTPILLERLGRK